MISGINYNKFCKWHVCPRYEQKLDTNEIEENDLIFLNLDFFEVFLNFIKINKPKYKFILVTQNSDRNFTSQMFNEIEIYVNKIYAINATFNSEKLFKIPLGFNDTAINYIQDIEHQELKSNLIYCNFKLGHHPDRRRCYDYFRQFKWCDIYEDGLYLDNVHGNQLSFTDFYNILKTYKYCLSPRGTGIDTHRLYESIYFGVVPIVKRNELIDMYENMPVLIIEDWNEITKEFLEENYEQLYTKLVNWVNKNKNWYKTEHWIKKN